MIRLEDIEVFIGEATTGSFARAARLTNIPPAQASVAVRRLEALLGMALFVRSTRSVRLTPAGEAYLPHAQAIVTSAGYGREAVRSLRESSFEGTLRLSVPSDLGRNLLSPWIAAFQAPYPGLTIKILTADANADIVREPVDAAVRYGTVTGQNLIALRLVQDNRRVLVAAPTYLRSHGTPQRLDDLAQHVCLAYGLGGRVYDRWRFPGSHGETSVAVTARYTSDDGDVVRRWAVEGLGVAYKSWLDVAADVRAGRLVHLLSDYPGESVPLHLVCADRRELTPALRALTAALRDRFEVFLQRHPLP